MTASMPNHAVIKMAKIDRNALSVAAAEVDLRNTATSGRQPPTYGLVEAGYANMASTRRLRPSTG